MSWPIWNCSASAMAGAEEISRMAMHNKNSRVTERDIKLLLCRRNSTENKQYYSSESRRTFRTRSGVFGFQRVVADHAKSGDADMDDRHPALNRVVPAAMHPVRESNRSGGAGGLHPREPC